MAVTVRRLAPDDDRSSFPSGDVDLDRFFARYAGQNQFRHHIGTTYVAVDDGGTIPGYATVIASELTASRLSEAKRRRLPAYPLPVVRLARLAVDRRAREHGIGRTIFRAVFGIAQRMAIEMGCVGIVVDAKSDAIGFYDKLGFIPLSVEAGEL